MPLTVFPRGWILVVLCCPLWLLAQNGTGVRFRQLGKKDGLSQSSVFAMAQDSLGYLWFGTRGGLNKYDGYRFTVYSEAAATMGPAGNDVRTLYVDPRTRALWVGTLAGLSRYDAAPDSFRVYQHRTGDPTSLTDGAVRAIYRDRRGRLWVGTSRGLSRYRPASEDFETFYPGKPGEEAPENHISFITEDPQGQVLLGTANGLYRLIDQPAEATPPRILPVGGLGSISLTAGAWDHSGNLWLGTFRDGVLRWTPTTGRLGYFTHDPDDPASLSHNGVRTLSVTPAGDLWVGTFAGLNLLRAGETSFVHYQNPDDAHGGLLDHSIRSLLIDRSGSLWVGTYYGGVHHLDERYNNFSNYHYLPHRNSLSWKVVSSFAETPDGDLYIGTEGGGLNLLDHATGRFTHYRPDPDDPQSLSGSNVKQLLLDEQQLWVGTFRAGLDRLDTRSGAFTHYRHQPNANSLASDNVYGLHREGDLLWILTFGGGLDLLDLRSGTFRNYAHREGDSLSISTNETRVILRSRDGTFWIGTEKGLNRATTDSAGYPVAFRTVLPREKIYALHEDRHGTIWLGTFSSGLYAYDPATNTRRQFTTADGLSGNTVFGILEAEDGKLWISTGNGLSQLDRQTKTFTNYDYSHGLDNLEYNFNAYHQLRSQELLFGGLNGFTRFDPARINQNEFVPPVVLTGLRQNNEEVPIGPDRLLQRPIEETEALTFAYGEADFTLRFAALDYFSPENNRYAYMLEGLDRDWNTGVGVTEVAYNIQREGEYTFLLRGANSDGVWNPVTRRLSIRVLPPPWRTWWAYLAYLLTVGGLLYALVHVLRLRHRVQLQAVAQRQQDELLEMKLRFFTNITHEFRTPLTLILGPLRQLVQAPGHSAETGRQLGLITQNAQRLLSLVNQVLTFRKLATDHEPLRVSQTDAPAFLSAIVDSFREPARLRGIRVDLVNTAGPLDLWLDAEKMEKVFYNLLSNALKFTPDGGSIRVRLEAREEWATVRVMDTGPGVAPELRDDIFRRFYEKSVGHQSTIKGSGIGLAISRQMVYLHHGKLDVAGAPSDPAYPGAEFVVALRRGSAHFGRQDIREAPLLPPTELPPAAPPEAVLPVAATARSASTAQTLLVIDDNAEIRDYVGSIFTGSYRVLSAACGRSGLALARAELPDLVISDVMMPEMDGIALCQAIKTDLEISHIPVILLTARTAEPYRLEGLRTGADDYVTKPFHPEELALRVHNMLSARRAAREKFARVVSLDPAEVTITNADEQFLEQALRTVEEQMGNYDFKAEDFATRLTVSRSLLFTKLKALTGQTPNNFVKTIRLKRAAQLLETGQLTVSEISHAVGFRDPKYFRRCFKEQHGVVPSAYEQHAAQEAGPQVEG